MSDDHLAIQEEIKNITNEEIPVEVIKELDLKSSLYKTKHPPKIIRVLTVVVYLLSVSLVAILLSTWYILAWESPAVNTTQSITYSKHGMSYLRSDNSQIVSTTSYDRFTTEPYND